MDYMRSFQEDQVAQVGPVYVFLVLPLQVPHYLEVQLRFPLISRKKTPRLLAALSRNADVRKDLVYQVGFSVLLGVFVDVVVRHEACPRVASRRRALAEQSQGGLRAARAGFVI
jgi:hypothetical protein